LVSLQKKKKRRKMSLCDLPPELLEVCCLMIDGHDILRLWTCGSSILQLKLGAGGGIKQFSIVGIQKWPTIVSHFPKLQHLSIVAGITEELKAFRYDSIISLPIELETLKIVARNAEFGFCVLPLASHRPSLSHHPQTSVVALDSKFPKLQLLQLHGTSLLTYSEFFLHLPASLKRLDLHYSGKIANKDLNFLPTTLEELNVACTARITDKGVSTLPRSLLRLDMWDSSSSGGKLFQHLPRTLVYLNIANFERISDEYVKNLPPQLEILVCTRDYFLTYKCVRDFPRSLTELHQSFNTHVNNSSVMDLPPKMTYLDWNMTPNVSASSFPALPRTLKTLLLDRSQDNLNGGYIQRLPPTLTHLSLGANSTMNDDSMEFLPNTITKLIMPSNMALTGASMFILPPKLEYLDLKANTAINQDVHLSGLPSTLTALLLGAKTFTDAAAPLLPRSLTFLSLPNNIEFTNAAIAELPRKLIHLDLSINGNLTDDCIQHMPRSLSLLRIRKAVLTNDCILHLPKKLQIFDSQNFRLSSLYFSMKHAKTI
jgi:hypothetical protein